TLGLPALEHLAGARRHRAEPEVRLPALPRRRPGGRRRKRKRVAVARQPMPAPSQLNECWAMDFMSDALISGRRFRILNVIDVLSREGLASEVDSGLSARRVIAVLEIIAIERGCYPARIIVDNG